MALGCTAPCISGAYLLYGGQSGGNGPGPIPAEEKVSFKSLERPFVSGPLFTSVSSPLLSLLTLENAARQKHQVPFFPWAFQTALLVGREKKIVIMQWKNWGKL